MELPTLQARRATLDDLPGLQALWQSLGLPWDQLDRYFTEFQIVPGADGSVQAAIGLLVEGAEALMHTEAIALASPESADECRATLWHRLQIVARNQGVARIWTQEDAPYWTASGFGIATPAQAAGLRATFADTQATWRIMQLADPVRTSKLVDEQVAIWDATRQQEREETRRKIQTFRNFAFLLAAVVIASLLLIAVFLFRKQPDLLQRILQR